MDAQRIHDLAHDLELALQCGDHDQALRHARDLRAAADAVCLQLTPLIVQGLDDMSDAELSGVAHG